MYEFCIIPGMIFCINVIFMYRDLLNSIRWQDERVERLEHMIQYLTEMMDTEVVQKRSSYQSICSMAFPQEAIVEETSTDHNKEN